MYENKELIEELNDLRLINSERIEKYKKELERVKDSEHISLFKRMIKEGIGYNEELDNEIKKKDPDQVWTRILRKGKIYKTWRNSITSEGRSISDDNEIIESATQKAYENVLSSDIYIPSHITSLIFMQISKLKQSFQQLLLKKQNLILENS